MPLGYKLAFSVSQFSRSPLYMVWNTQMHQAAFRDDAAEVFGRAFTRHPRRLPRRRPGALPVGGRSGHAARRSALRRRAAASHSGGGSRLLFLDRRRPDGLRFLRVAADRLEGARSRLASTVVILTLYYLYSSPATACVRCRRGALTAGRLRLPRSPDMAGQPARLPPCSLHEWRPDVSGSRAGGGCLGAVAFVLPTGPWAVPLKGGSVAGVRR